MTTITVREEKYVTFLFQIVFSPVYLRFVHVLKKMNEINSYEYYRVESIFFLNAKRFFCDFNVMNRISLHCINTLMVCLITDIRSLCCLMEYTLTDN